MAFRGRYYSKPKLTILAAFLHYNAYTKSAVGAVKDAHGSVAIIRTKLIQSVNHDHIGDILQHYESIKRFSGHDISNVLSLHDLQYMLRTLLGAANRNKLSFCMRMVEDAVRSFGSAIDVRSVYSQILDAAVTASLVDMVYGLFLEPPADFRPSRKHFIDVMTFYGRSGDVEKLRVCIDALKHQDYTPTVAEYALLIDATFRKKGTITANDFLIIFAEMGQLNLPFDGELVKLLRRRTNSLGAEDLQAHQLIKEYQKHCIVPIPKTVMDDWFRNVRAILIEKGINAATRELERLQEKGLIADSRTLSAITSAATTLEQMRGLENVLGIRANIISWSNLIRNTLNIRGLPHALEAYEEAKLNGIKPDWIMVYPLLKALCQSSVKYVTEDNLMQALSIYHDVDRSVPEFYISQNSSPSPESREASPQIKVYNILLIQLYY